MTRKGWGSEFFEDISLPLRRIWVGRLPRDNLWNSLQKRMIGDFSRFNSTTWLRQFFKTLKCLIPRDALLLIGALVSIESRENKLDIWQLLNDSIHRMNDMFGIRQIAVSLCFLLESKCLSQWLIVIFAQIIFNRKSFHGRRRKIFFRHFLGRERCEVFSCAVQNA